MATSKSPTQNRTPDPNSEPNFLDGEDNHFYLSSNHEIQITDPHPLFNIQVIETHEQLITHLKEMQAHKNFENDYDGIDVLCYKTEQAINKIIKDDEHISQAITTTNKQISRQAKDEFDSFADFGYEWYSTFLDIYNGLLKENTPSAYNTLRECAKQLNEDSTISNDAILKTILHDLNMSVDEI